MNKKQLIETSIHLLQSVDPESIESVNFDRMEYDDGSVGFSVNLMTPATKSPSTEELKAAYSETDKLANFLLALHPSEIGKDGKNESAVDVAIKLIEQYT